MTNLSDLDLIVLFHCLSRVGLGNYIVDNNMYKHIPVIVSRKYDLLEEVTKEISKRNIDPYNFSKTISLY